MIHYFHPVIFLMILKAIEGRGGGKGGRGDKLLKQPKC